MRKEVHPSGNSQRVSRSVGKKKISVQKGVKRAASTNLKQEVKKRKTNNSSGTLIAGLEEVSSSRRDSFGQAGDHSIKAKKKTVTVKITSRRVISKKPVQGVKGKKQRVKNDSGKVVAKQKQKKVVVQSGKKSLKVKAIKSSTAVDKGPKDGKNSGKKSADKMGKAVAKKTPDSSPDRRVSEIKRDSEPHKKQNKNKTTVKTVTSTKVSKISNVKKAEKPVKKPSKKDTQKIKGKPGISEEINKSAANGESKVTTKKGRRKCTSKSGKSLESSPSRSPSRETSPLKSKPSNKVTEKPAVKGKKPEKKATKEKDQSKSSKDETEKTVVTEIQKASHDINNAVCTNDALDTVGVDDVKKKQLPAKEDSAKNSKESSKVESSKVEGSKVENSNVESSTPEEQICDQKSQLDIKCMPPKKLIKQKVEIEHEMKVKKAKQSEEDLSDDTKTETHDDVNNDSSTSDEIPLNEIMKRSVPKQQESDSKAGGELKTSSKLLSESISNSPKVDDDKRHQSSADENEEKSLVQDSSPDEKTNNFKCKKETVPEKKFSKCVKDDQSKKTSDKNKKDFKMKKEIKSTLKSKETTEKKAVKQKVAKLVKKSKLGDVRNRQKGCNVQTNKSSDKSDSDSRTKRLKLFGFWNGPKRHRVASLNALAKVHCLYENESRTALSEMCDSSSSNTTQSYSNKTQPKKAEEKPKESSETKEPPAPTHTRTLRSAPGLRAPGRHWDMLNVSTTSPSTTSEDSSDAVEVKKLTLQPSVKQKQSKKTENDMSSCSSEEENKTSIKTTKTEEDNIAGTKKVKKRRKRYELMMDLKDMVVRKRMASLNASAILAASYSVEKRAVTKKDDGADEDQKKEKKKEAAEKKSTKKRPIESSPDMEAEDSSGDEDVIVRSTNGKSKQKVAVIVNQDTDVTITGVYVNSTTRSTHHEGYCSIAGMQYRISSTSHTQTEATAVSTETVLHTEHPTSGHRIQETAPPPTVSHAIPPPCKSYTPLDALSSMQPPGHHHSQPPPRTAPLSPIGRRHGCSSAFTAPPNYGPHQPPPPGPPQVQQQDPGYIHGYYQPAGPLISTHHHHHHSATSSSSSVTSKLPPPSGPAPSTLPTPTPPPSSAPHPASESSDNEVIITATSSESNPPPISYRYPSHPSQPYSSYNYQYYPSPPATANLQYPAPQQTHYHQEICYSSTPSSYPPPPGYFHHKSGPYPPPTYHRRYGPPPQYYSQDFYANPPNPNSNPPLPPSQQQMIVTAPTGTSSASFPPPESGYPPPPAPMVDSYPPPPPPTYYPAYSTGPPPPCYSHSPPSRSLAFIDAYQSCPCPMQSCPKNVLTGPLTGVSKGSIKNHQTTPLPPVALALPLEPPGALGPPSPARGSAGMPPPPSPALATARNPTNGQWSESPPETSKPPDETKTETGLLAISKVLSESVMVADQDIGGVENTIVTLSLPKTENVKIEVEDSVFNQESNEVKPNRKRRKYIKTMTDCKKQITEVYNENSEIKIQTDLQERLKVPAEKLEISDVEKPVEKQLPLSDNGATVPVKKQVKKRKSTEEENQEPLPKMAKCEKSKVCEKPCDKVKKQKVQQVGKKCAKRDKSVTEENIEPEETDNVKVSEVAKIQNRRRSSKSSGERRKSSSSPPQGNRILEIPVEAEFTVPTAAAPKKKKTVAGKKATEKANAEQTVKCQAVSKERRNSKNGKGNGKSDTSPGRNVKKITHLEENNSEDLELLITLAPRKVQLTPKWSNGWSWEGQPFIAKVFLTTDDVPLVRKCYPAMRHVQGDIICPYDCVLLKSGPRKTDLPFVAKVAAMWDNPEDGEMMVSLLWYYRPEHTEQGRRPEDTPDEIFASRHKDTNSVACIEDKCFVLTFSEYCRYRKNVKRIEEGCPVPPRVVPLPDGGAYPRSERQPPGQVAPDLVFFCRRVYDFRQKRILKNPC